MPRFSVIVVHYQGSVSHAVFCRGIQSLQAQAFRDFEILCYHDGPLLDPSLQFPIPVICTDKRLNDWGHSLRDRGLREARGDYIVIFNADNVLYPNALQEISSAIDRPIRIYHPVTKKPLDTNAIVIFTILMRGAQRFGEQWVRFPDHPEYGVVLSGNPPRAYYIDALQFVMRRDLWLAEGGWYDKSHAGDGLMYEKFALKYGYRALESILGEHH